MKKRLLSIVLTLCMVLMLMPQAVFADGGVDYLYCDANGANWQTGTKQTGKYTVVTSSDTEWTTGWYVVNSNLTIGSEKTPQRVTVSGDVHLILADGCTLTVNGGILGDDSVDANLTIYAQSTGDKQGKLMASGTGSDSDSYGIYVSGNMTINGGSVKAVGGKETSGKYYSYGILANNITINGGNVQAEADINGIVASGDVTINGGSVESKSDIAVSSDVTINGGAVVFASSINSGENNVDLTNCIVFKGNEGKVYGTSVTPSVDFTIPAGKTLTVGEGQTLTIPAGVTLTIENGGTLTNKGTIINFGTIRGTVSGNQPKIPIGTTNYLDETGAEQTCTSATEVTSSNTTWNAGWYVVKGDVPINSRVTVSGEVHLILADGCKLTVNGGIQVQDNDNTPSNGSANALTIYGQAGGTGKLIAQKVGDSDLNAAIGGNGSGTDTGSGGDGGTITINGGIVEATSDMGAGIGGGSSGTGGTGNFRDSIGGSSGTIIINGGKVTAISISGAGIGGGGGHDFYKDNGTITINGGIVKATGEAGAGIGSGCRGSGGKIAITGGIVTATSNGGAGIGSGDQDSSGGGEITITGGNVTAKSTRGVGIGASRIFYDNSVDGTITIKDGTVTAIGGNAQEKCYGVLASNVTVNGGSVKVESGSPRQTNGPTQSYGIYAATELTITGGTVEAEGGNVTFKNSELASESYGIYAATELTISGGTVKAEGGEATLSYGIYVNGTSGDTNSGIMTISGNADVTAIGGEADGESFGIYAYKELSISGGTVKAEGGKAEDSYGIYAYNVTVNGSTFKAEGGEAGNNSHGISASNVTIKGSTVKAEGGKAGNNSYGIITPEKVTIANSTVEAKGGTATRNNSTGIVTFDGVTITGSSHVIARTSGEDTLGRHAMSLGSSLQLPETYWWRIADNNAFTASSTKAYVHSYSDTYVEITDHFTVTLDSNYAGGESDTVTTGMDGTLTEALPTLSREGYTFDGWYTDAEGGKAVTNDTVFNGFVTIYAHWTAETTVEPPVEEPDEIPYVPVPQAPQNGWKSLTAGSVYYKNGVKVKGLQQIDGETYYFDEKGYLQTGWVELDGDWYYFDAAMQTGWLKQGNTWYYLDPRNGAMAEDGMQEIDGATYYFHDWGGMASNFWYLDEKGDWYYFGGDGAMVENKWVLCNGLWYYLGSDGEMLAEKWLYWNGEWYYLGSDGAMLTNTTTPDGYYVGNDGVWVK